MENQQPRKLVVLATKEMCTLCARVHPMYVFYTTHSPGTNADTDLDGEEAYTVIGYADTDHEAQKLIQGTWLMDWSTKEAGE